MSTPTFLTPSPLLPLSKNAALLTTPRSLSKQVVTGAAVAVTLSLTTFPVRPLPETLHPAPSVIVKTTDTKITTPLVVGVAKSAIHDYPPYKVQLPSTEPHQTISQTTVSRSPTSQNQHLDDEARREISLAIRLITAVILGVILGIERRATSFNLGVRCITLISLSSSILCLMGGRDGLHMPLITVLPHMGVLTLAAGVGMAVFAVARMRHRRTRHIGGMCWTVVLGVAMGGACGAGLSLLAGACFLVAVAVMRADGGKKVGAGRVRDSSAVGGDGLRFDGFDGVKFDGLINSHRENGKGVST